MTKQTITIPVSKVKPDDRIVGVYPGSDRFTVEREVQTDYPKGTVVQVDTNRYFRTAEGWVGRSGARYTLDEIQAELNHVCARVVLEA